MSHRPPGSRSPAGIRRVDAPPSTIVSVAISEHRGKRDAATPGGTVVLTNVVALPSNPFLRLWVDAAQRAGASVSLLAESTVFERRDRRPGWVHLQWPERVLDRPSAAGAALRVARLLFLISVARARGARVLLTAHNVWSHDGKHPRLERLLYRSLGLVTTDVHLLSEAGAAEFFDNHPWLSRARRHYIPLGNYAPVVAGAPGRAEARRELGFEHDERIFVTFGLLKSYKGVEELLDAFRALQDGRARLIVAGRVRDAHLEGAIQRAHEADARIRVLARHLDDAELATAIRAADHVILPYRRVLNSSSALLALTLARPVLLPRTPTFEALGDRIGGRWVSLFGGELSTSHLADLSVPGDSQPDLSWCDWERVSDQLSALWRSGPA
jgi:beta-1,4-mannosyltransferase